MKPIDRVPGCMTVSPAAVALLAGLSAGCASEPPPSLIQARAAVEQAQTAPAGEYSALEMHEAQERLAAAEAAANEEENEDAERLAQEALINVELAEAKAEMERAQGAAEELGETTQTLRQETERTTDAIVPGAGASQ